jgi:hypothetical protein
VKDAITGHLGITNKQSSRSILLRDQCRHPALEYAYYYKVAPRTQ